MFTQNVIAKLCVIQFFRKLGSNAKMVVKVASKSDAVLTLVGLTPTYVSLNEDEGKIECGYFFPNGYDTQPQIKEIEELEELKRRQAEDSGVGEAG